MFGFLAFLVGGAGSSDGSSICSILVFLGFLIGGSSWDFSTDFDEGDLGDFVSIFLFGGDCVIEPVLMSLTRLMGVHFFGDDCGFSIINLG